MMVQAAGSCWHEDIDTARSTQKPGIRGSVAQDRHCVLLLGLFSPGFGHWVWFGPLAHVNVLSQALNLWRSPAALGLCSWSPVASSLTVHEQGVYLSVAPRDTHPDSVVHTS